MSVAFDPHATPAASGSSVDDISSVDPSRFKPHYGNSGSPSTIASYDSSCSAPLFTLFASLLNSFLRSDETPFDIRMNTGKRVLSEQFERDFFYQADAFHSAVIVVMEYNKQTLMFFETMQGEYSSKATQQLRQLLSGDDNRNCNEGTLEIKTLLIQTQGRYV